MAILTFEVNFKAQQAQVIYQLQQFYIMLAEKNPPPCCIYSTFYTGICFFLFFFTAPAVLFYACLDASSAGLVDPRATATSLPGHSENGAWCHVFCEWPGDGGCDY